MQKKSPGDAPSRLEPLFTVDEVAKATRRSRATIYRDIKAKRLLATKFVGSTRISAGAYRRYLESTVA